MEDLAKFEHARMEEKAKKNKLLKMFAVGGVVLLLAALKASSENRPVSAGA